MRRVLLTVTFLTLTAAAGGQLPKPPEPRYGIPPQLVGYPQSTPQEALASAIRAAEKGRYEYLGAHLIDPAVIDGRVAERAKLLADGVDREFRLVRDQQLRQGVLKRDRLPDDEAAFKAAVDVEARQRAFRAIRAAVGEHLRENPETLSALRKFARVGTLAEAADGATMTLAGEPGVQLPFRKVESRWFVGDRKAPPPVQQP